MSSPSDGCGVPRGKSNYARTKESARGVRAAESPEARATRLEQKSARAGSESFGVPRGKGNYARTKDSARGVMAAESPEARPTTLEQKIVHGE